MPARYKRKPTRTYDYSFHLRVDDAFLRNLDLWRRLWPDLPSRGEALRPLVAGKWPPHTRVAPEEARTLFSGRRALI